MAMPRPTVRQIFERLIPPQPNTVAEQYQATRRPQDQPQEFRVTTNFSTSSIILHHMASTATSSVQGYSYAIG